jgi:hypothetical protein
MVALSACEPEGVPRNEEQGRQWPDDGPIVFVVARDTEFKKAVVEATFDKLAEAGYLGETDDLEAVSPNFLQEEDAPFDVVVILDSASRQGFSPEGKRLFDASDKDKVVVMLTKDDEHADWTPDISGVDAMTAASDMDNVDATATMIVDKVKEVQPVE